MAPAPDRGLGEAQGSREGSVRAGAEDGGGPGRGAVNGTRLSILHSKYSFDSYLHKPFSKLFSRRHLRNFSLKRVHSPRTEEDTASSPKPAPDALPAAPGAPPPAGPAHCTAPARPAGPWGGRPRSAAAKGCPAPAGAVTSWAPAEQTAGHPGGLIYVLDVSRDSPTGQPSRSRAARRSPKWSSGKLPLSGGRGWKLLVPKFMAVDMMVTAPEPPRAIRALRRPAGRVPSRPEASAEHIERPWPRGPASRTRPRPRGVAPFPFPGALKSPDPAWDCAPPALSSPSPAVPHSNPTAEETEAQRGSATCPRTHSFRAHQAPGQRLAGPWPPLRGSVVPASGPQGLTMAPAY